MRGLPVGVVNCFVPAGVSAVLAIVTGKVVGTV